MKKIIRKVANSFGYEIKKAEKKYDPNGVVFSKMIPEINDFEKETIRTCLKYSMTGAERMWAIVQAMKRIADKKIPGDLVEAGVYRGGNILLFKILSDKYDLKKEIWAYDTYKGMTEPTKNDISFRGTDAKKLMDDAPIKEVSGEKHNIWCYSTMEEVQSNILAHAKNIENINFIKGGVEQTLKIEKNLPKQISLLRLDTDWYESTKIEMECLYPRLVPGGILIVDDYGHWKGSRKAIDEYFSGKNIFFHRVDYTCRLLVKD
jgi:hypothetical protein